MKKQTKLKLNKLKISKLSTSGNIKGGTTGGGHTILPPCTTDISIFICSTETQNNQEGAHYSD